MVSLTIENYVKAIYTLCKGEADCHAATGQIASSLGVSPGTVTSMLKTLSESGLATYAPYEGARLTAAGRNLALRVLRRHRLIELFLSKTLDLNWDEVHDEAEHMEHAVSDLLIDRIDKYLDFPEVDPHGDPIPRADLSLEHPQSRSLATLDSGATFRFARVLDQSTEFLRFLTEQRLSLGAEGSVVSNQRSAGTITVLVGGRRTTLALDAADKLLVSPATA